MASSLKFVKGKWGKIRGRKESSAEKNAQFVETDQGTAEELCSSKRSVSLNYFNVLQLSAFYRFNSYFLILFWDQPVLVQCLLHTNHMSMRATKLNERPLTGTWRPSDSNNFVKFWKLWAFNTLILHCTSLKWIVCLNDALKKHSCLHYLHFLKSLQVKRSNNNFIAMQISYAIKIKISVSLWYCTPGYWTEEYRMSEVQRLQTIDCSLTQL